MLRLRYNIFTITVLKAFRDFHRIYKCNPYIMQRILALHDIREAEILGILRDMRRLGRRLCSWCSGVSRATSLLQPPLAPRRRHSVRRSHVRRDSPSWSLHVIKWRVALMSPIVSGPRGGCLVESLAVAAVFVGHHGVLTSLASLDNLAAQWRQQ